MKYRKFGNIVYLVFFLFFIFILFYHSDILDLPKQTIQPYDKSRVIEFMDKNSNKDFILLDISAFVRLFVNCTSFCILALQDKVIEIIKRFFRSKLNIFFTIIIFIIWIALKRYIYSLKIYTLPMAFLNSTLVSIFMIYFINSKETNRDKI
ncbi:MAG: hypothetical protein E6163_06350 [Peptoniphilus lacydonensis]|nr:hypothetical protein [Peptoniphilus lacydonensis]